MGLRRLLDKDFSCVMDACLQMQHSDQEGAAHMHKLEAVGSGSPCSIFVIKGTKSCESYLQWFLP